MKRNIALILIVLGLIMLVWTGFTYTQKKKLVDAGPIQITTQKEKTFNWPPYIGGIVLVAGVVILTSSKRA